VASWRSELTVRPGRASQTAQFQQLLQAHHWLGSRLTRKAPHMVQQQLKTAALRGYRL
jgi:hypothetical protein